jgi:hypothetical protein
MEMLGTRKTPLGVTAAVIVRKSYPCKKTGDFIDVRSNSSF